jgi:hypothetical protein
MTKILTNIKTFKNLLRTINESTPDNEMYSITLYDNGEMVLELETENKVKSVVFFAENPKEMIEKMEKFLLETNS